MNLGLSSRSLLLALPLLLVACADDDPAGPGADVLTEAEVAGLVEVLITAGTDNGVGDAAASLLPSRAAAAEQTVEFPVDDTFPCELGGSVRVEGTVTVIVDDTSGNGAYSHEITQDWQSCRIRSERLEQDFVLDGDPSVISRVNIEIVAEQVVSLEGSEKGAVAWRLDGRSGVCPVDLTYAISPTLPAQPVYAVTGTVCGRSVNLQVDGA